MSTQQKKEAIYSYSSSKFLLSLAICIFTMSILFAGIIKNAITLADENSTSSTSGFSPLSASSYKETADNIHEGDAIWYSLNVETTGVIGVNTTTEGGSSNYHNYDDIYLYLYDPTGNEVATNYGYNHQASIAYTATSTGTFKAKAHLVTSWGDDGTRTVMTSSNYPLSTSPHYMETTNDVYEGDAIWYSLNVETTGVIGVNTTTEGGSSNYHNYDDIYLYLYDPTGNEVATNYGYNHQASIAYTATSTGTFKAKAHLVTSWGDDGTRTVMTSSNYPWPSATIMFGGTSTTTQSPTPAPSPTPTPTSSPTKTSTATPGKTPTPISSPTVSPTPLSITVTCEQENTLDNGDNCNWPYSQTDSRCCCWCPDPTGAHAYGHVMDLEKTVSNVNVYFEIKPGAGDAGCATTGYMYYSLDGKSWTSFWSQQNLQGWTTYTNTVYVQDSFRYVRANTDGCSVDWSKIVISDGNPSGSTPTVTTGYATDVTSNSATLNGIVNPNGSSTTAWFRYGTTTGSFSNTSSIQNLGSGVSDESVSIGINGLLQNTQYYYRIVAQNSAGITYGSETTFTTSTTSPTPSPSHLPTPSPTSTTSPVKVSIVYGTVNDSYEDTLEGVTVIIAGEGISESTATDEDGYYEFQGLAAGDYTLTYEIEGYVTQTQKISLKEGEEKDLGTITMPKMGSIYGYVVNIKEEKINKARVKLKGINTKFIETTYSDADGYFEATELEADTYLLFARKRGYLPKKVRVKLKEGDEKDVGEIILRRKN